MSFKRTSGALREEGIIVENSRTEIPDELQTGVPETVRPLEVEFNNAHSSGILISLDATDLHRTDSTSSTGHSQSLESAFITVQEAYTPRLKQELNDLNARCCIIKDSKVDENVLCTNLDLCSEKSCRTGFNSIKEATTDGSSNNCVHCRKLEKDILAKDTKIDDTNRRLHDLMQKHRLFVVSNCQLNEENDLLKTDIDRLKLELRALTFTNSQLRSENEQIRNQLATKEEHQLVNRGINLAYNPPSPINSNTEEQFSSTFKDNLKEAVVLSHKQQNDVKMLRKQLLSQNHTIKMLYAQIQKSNHNQQRNASPAELLQLNKHKEISDDEMVRTIAKNKPVANVIETVRSPLQNSVVEDSDDIIQLKDDDDDFAYSNNAYVPVTVGKERASPHKEGPRVVAMPPLQVQYKKTVPETQDRQFGTKNGIYRPNVRRPPVSVGAESMAIEETAATPVKTAYDLDRLFEVEVLWCPLCNKKFSGVGEEFRRSFQNHVADCNFSQQHQCPLCFMTFPRSMPIADFEQHVDRHFRLQPEDFEVLERSSRS